MDAIKHYGVVISWLQDKQMGVVRDKDDVASRLLLLASELPAGYREPKVGDEITYLRGIDNHNRPCALSPEPIAAHDDTCMLYGTVTEGDLVELKVDVWDIKKNGGFGMLASQPAIPVFALGQFLKQFNVPQIGDTLRGRLKRHKNGQWLLVDIDILHHRA